MWWCDKFWGERSRKWTSGVFIGNYSEESLNNFLLFPQWWLMIDPLVCIQPSKFAYIERWYPYFHQISLKILVQSNKLSTNPNKFYNDIHQTYLFLFLRGHPLIAPCLKFGIGCHLRDALCLPWKNKRYPTWYLTRCSLECEGSMLQKCVF